jgi:mannose-1-phosphate guanylyltransferase
MPHPTGKPETAVILSGGEGVRLRPITRDLPKGLVRVGGKPLLQWVVEWLRENGVSDIVMGVGYLKDEIIKFFDDGSRFRVRIRYSVHTVEGGTGEGFRLAISRFVKDETFVALNGDQITDLSLSTMARVHEKSGALATLAVVHPKLPFGQVLIGEDGYCEGFFEKPILEDVFISSGIYIFDREILKYLPAMGDVEKTTFPKLTQLRKLRAYKHDGSFITVNSMRELEEAEEQLRKVSGK